MKYIILLVPNWNYTDGGINSFNFDFGLALGQVTKNTRWKVICVSAKSTLSDLVERAQSNGVEVFSLNSKSGEYNVREYNQVKQKISELPNNEYTYFIGHDVFTGEAANYLALEYPTKSCSVVFHHMDYDSYYAIKGDNTTDELDQKLSGQNLVLMNAHFVVGVGPKLFASAKQKTGKENVFELIPGFPTIPTKSINKFTAITFGRYDVRTDKLKQMALGARAFVQYASDLKGDLRKDATLKAIGISAEEERKAFTASAADGISGYFNIITLPYSTNREELFDHLAKSTVCLMLSVHEGFGLVGWEAIAAGVPLIVSENTGLLIFLKKLAGKRDLKDLGVVPVHVLGSMDGKVNKDDLLKVRQAMKEVAENEKFYRKGALKLRKLLSKKYSWREGGEAFLDVLEKADGRKASSSDTLEEGIHHRAQAVRRLNSEGVRQPILVLTIDPTASQLKYFSRSIVLIGRKNHLDRLNDFTSAQDKFLWYQLLGEGGIGKSRMAFEFVLQKVTNENWYGGFLTGDVLKSFDWDNWEPRFDTFVIIDYASRYTNNVGELIGKLNRAQRLWPCKVRILLIDRFKHRSSWEQFDYQTKMGEFNKPWAEPLEVEGLNDVEVRQFINEYKDFPALQLSKKDVFNMIRKAPKYNLPLYTFLLLEDLRQRRGYAREENVFELYLQREHFQVWSKMITDQRDRELHEALVALATIAGGLDINQLVPNRFLPEKICTELLVALNLFQSKSNMIHPVEPDLLGEYYVLMRFFSSESASKEYRTDLFRLAWRLNTPATKHFVQRMIYDFPMYSFEEMMFLPNTDDDVLYKESWCDLQSDFLKSHIENTNTLGPEVLQTIENLEALVANGPELRSYLVNALATIHESAARIYMLDQADPYTSKLVALIADSADPELVRKAAYLFLRVGRFAMKHIGVEMARWYINLLKMLARVDLTITSTQFVEKLSNEIGFYAQEWKRHKDATTFKFEKGKKLDKGNVEKYVEESKVICTLIEACFLRKYDIVTAVKHLKRIQFFEDELGAATIMELNQWAMGKIINSALNQGEVKKSLIIKFNDRAVNKLPEIVGLKTIIFWSNNINKLCRVDFKFGKQIARDLAGILSQSKIGGDVYPYYWSMAEEVVRYCLDNEDLKSALEFFGHLQGMLSLEKHKQDRNSLARAAASMSYYYRRSGDLESEKQCETIVREYASNAKILLATTAMFDSFENESH